MLRCLETLLCGGLVLLGASFVPAAEFPLRLRYQKETKADSGRYHTLHRDESWKPAETAVILCDFWDLHHCRSAVRRMEEFGPRLNEFLKTARAQGATIIHSPSDCMPAYADHPARTRAIAAPKATNAPTDVELWCSRIPAEERADYPIDQSDGGEDDDPAEHAEWRAKLTALGRNPNLPWKRQSDMITIDAARDYLSDRGDEVWNILEQRGIRNVILAGVHTNMCVLGRPFGLRQLVRGGKNVVLLRDMTDTMYNPACWPWVSHFTANDLIISHVERFVCPTITSDQLLGGKPFRFSGDKRPHLVLVIAESGYDTGRTLSRFAARRLGDAFHVTTVHGSETDPYDLPGLEVLKDADVALVSVRRRPLRAEQMGILRQFIEAGKPVIGIRTASHAFALSDNSTPEGTVTWPKFDAEVFGGNYHGHPKPMSPATLQIAPASSESPLLSGIPRESFQTGGSLYFTAPLAKGTEVLLTGTHETLAPEPVAWTFIRADGGRSFYTSLGEPADFDSPVFQRLLRNAVFWAAGLPEKKLPDRSLAAECSESWMTVAIPPAYEKAMAQLMKDYRGPVWHRCVVRIPVDAKGQPFSVALPADTQASVWWNGRAAVASDAKDGLRQFTVDPAAIEAGDANLLVVRIEKDSDAGGLTASPVLSHGRQTLPLKGRWQLRLGNDASWSNMPLPSKFGGATDIVFDLPHRDDARKPR